MAGSEARRVAQTVLLVDDDASMRKVLQRRVETWGYAVLGAGDGAEALRLAQERKPDLVLLDVMMPGLDGLEVCRQLTRGPFTRQIPVILISAKASQISGEEIEASGAFASLQKPYDPSDLLARMKEAIRRGVKGT